MPLTISSRLSAFLRSLSDTIDGELQLNAGSGAITSDKSRADISTMFATIGFSNGPSGNKSGKTSRMRPLRTRSTCSMRVSRSEYI